MTTTPIEDRIAWKIPHPAFDAAKAKGASFHDATLAGFAATSPRDRTLSAPGGVAHARPYLRVCPSHVRLAGARKTFGQM